MRRILLLATLTIGAFAAAPGVASADVFGPDAGHVPAGFEELHHEYVTLNSNNQPAANGAKVGFFVEYRCDSGESIGLLYHASQGEAGGPPEGGGSKGASCNEGPQHVLLIVQRSTLPLFDSTSSLVVKGVGVSATASNLTDLDADDHLLDPFNPDDDT